MHVSLLNMENVIEKEKTKALAAAKEVSENTKRAKLLENYNRSSQLKKQRRLEVSQNAREIDPETAAIDNVTLDMIDEEPQRVKRKRSQYARPKNWHTIVEHYGQWGKKNTIRAFPNDLRAALLDRLMKHYDSGVKILIVKCRPKLTLRIELQRMGILYFCCRWQNSRVDWKLDCQWTILPCASCW